MRADPLGLITSAAREYGDVVRLRLLQDVLLIAHPDGVKRVLQDNHLNYAKGFGYERIKPVVGNGLLTAEGEHWKRQRRLAQPAFHRQRIQSFAEAMVRRAEAMLRRWEGQTGPLDVHAEMTRLTLGVVGETLFSVDLDGKADAVGRALTEVLEITEHRFQKLFLWPAALPTPQNRRFSKSMRVLESLVTDIVEARRREGVEKEDLLGMFMAARDEDTGAAMDDGQLRDEVMTMALAGHETTANALTFAFYLLSLHPEVERALHLELDSVLGGRAPTVADLPRLEYTTRVVEETLRLYPPAWLVGRKALEDDEVMGYSVPKGTTVFLSPYVTHRDARFWENPEGFDPERFRPEVSAKRHRAAYFPFAMGPRMCIGDRFAQMEMQLVLATVASRWRLPLLGGKKVELSPQVTLRPKGGVWVTPERRQ